MRDIIEQMGLVRVENIAQIAGVEISRVRRWADDPTFPKPVAEAPSGNLYHRREVAQWLMEHGEKGMPAVPAP